MQSFRKSGQFTAFGRYGYVKKYKNIEPAEIVNLTVQDETGNNYEFVEEFNSSISKEKMIGKCGILKENNETKLYWGVTEDGQHEYIIKYQVKNFIKKYNNNILKGTKLDFIDDTNLADIYLTISADNYNFTSQNTNVQNFDSKRTKVSYLENGNLYLEFNPYYLEGNEIIAFDENAPFQSLEIFYNNKPIISTKKQDIVVISILVTLSVLYLIGDICRIINEYKLQERKYNVN